MTEDTLPLSGRVAIVTGASAGIGLAIVERLVRAGCRAVLNARRGDRLTATCERLQASRRSEQPIAVAVAGDAADQAVIGATFAAAKEHFDAPADLVVANAGRGLSGSVMTSDPGQWEAMIQTNLIGAARLMRAAAEQMLQQATAAEGETGVSGPWLSRPRDVVLIGSTVGRHISPFSSMYGSTKFALHSLGEALRREVGPKGVRVSIVEPGVVESEFQSVAGYDAANFGAFMRRIGPVVQPEDVARSVEFMVSQPAHIHVADLLIRPTRQDYP